MNTPDTFKAIVLNGRPASGKSEIIDYLKKTPIDERKRRFHIGEFEEFDDFLYVWTTFEEDDILSKHGKERVWTDKRYFFKDPFVWNLFIERINLAVRHRTVENAKLMNGTTAMIEFSRGGDNGFGEAYGYLSEEILKNAGIVYIKVSYDESIRKNQRRARKGREHSILYHTIPDEKMNFYYKVNDWEELTKASPTHIQVKGIDVPYSVFPNEPEVTDKPDALGNTLEETLNRLWKLHRN